mmetsp:Transcript_45125/g.109828  ORF Transcript_45125/g.109828 Transcript_45125/m.109828 type:complete len:1253 (-) Transcript_45125:37-3795(-)
MGCGSSKATDAKIAEDFFGGPSVSEHGGGGGGGNTGGVVVSRSVAAPTTASLAAVETSPVKSSKPYSPPPSNVEELESPRKNKQKATSSPTKKTKKKKVPPAGSSGDHERMKSPTKATKSADANASKLTSPSKQRTNYVAPPSCESFVSEQQQQRQAKPQKQHKEKPSTPRKTTKEEVAKEPLQPEGSVALPPPPPPPPPMSVPSAVVNDTTNNDDHDESINSRPAVVLDDDDFSVAPSLAVEMRSITNHTFDDVYQRGTQLGYGAFAMVYIGTHRPTGAKYAIKQVDRSKMFWGERDALKDEILNLQKVRAGPNIVQLYEVFEEQTYCYLVTELMPGGELFDRIIEKKTFSEKEARNSIRCVLEALQYMHEHRVAHRDLKPENLLLKDPNGLIPVKLADFGFAKSVEKKNSCRTLCGTPGYLAPEILERFPAYDLKCDIWSVGVILFLLLSGYLPFDDDDEDKVFDRTRNGEYDFRPEFWRHISPGAKELVTRCLTINPKKRYSATRCLQHEWMAEKDTELESHQLDVEKLKNAFEAKRKMKAAINTLVAANRLKQLNDDFSDYLDRRRQDSIVSHFSYMTTGTKFGHAKFTEDSPSGRPFKDFYDVRELLGEGGHSYIYRCIRKSTNLPYAVKHVQISKLEKKAKKTIKDEIAVLKLLRGGPHIVRMFDVFQDKDDAYLIFEEMKGGNLLSRIAEKEIYTEREARQVCKIAFLAIDYCHKKKVAHRDIKPECFLLVEGGDDATIKIADFGFAKKVTRENSLKTLCGTPGYVAPEIIDPRIKYYDHRCDIWSLGVFVYILLGGYPPFEGVLENLSEEIMRGYFDFHEEYWSDVSQSAKDMITSMLVVNPAERISASQALSCKWMQAEDEQLIARDLSGTQESIRKTLQPTEKVKMAVTAIIARNKLMSIAGMLDKDSNMNAFNESMGIIDDWQDDSFGDFYLWGDQIGVGTYSVVHEVLRKDTQQVYAAKRISRKDLHPSDAVALHDEIAALQQVTECEQIVKLYDVYDEPDFTFLVLESMKGGDLIDRIIEKRHYTEYDAKEVSRKLLMGVAYCHKKKIANRNLKPENLLLKAGSDTDVKISDFGYAKTVTFPNCLQTQCGTEGYVAPEILEHRPNYDVPCDMWSLGVIIYIVLGGYRPFRGEGEEVMKQIRYGEYKFHKRYWSHVSDDAKSLIAGMLTVDPEKRITAQEALQSPWIQSEKGDLGTELSDNMTDLKNLRSAKRKIKGAVNTIIATNKLQSIGEFRAYQDF